ncbi:MAG: helix-turn-helix domain-containing protein [Alicyclobacillus sp.]|nr:helix-turn-helix domain-containing protein [Alicyclobacillus sp.]
MKTRTDYPVVLTAEEVAEILRCHRNHAYEVLRQARAQGWFPVHKIARSLKIPRDRFFEWLEERPVEPEHKPAESPKPRRGQLALVARRVRYL